MSRTLIIGIVTAFAGITLAETAPHPQSQQPSAPAAAYSGSLMKDATHPPTNPGQATAPPLAAYSLFAVPAPEPKTFKRHDLVTIVVREQSTFASQGTTDLKKQADLEAKVDEFIKLSIANFAIQGGAQGANPPSVKGSLDRNFKGEASVDRTDKFVTRVTAEIIDVKPNGTMVLQARGSSKLDDEEQTFILSGICRTEDILPDNTILSTQLYDLDLTQSHKGAVRDTTKRGWIPKLLDALNPF
jgi:flagellar L-ring protein FlgH